MASKIDGWALCGYKPEQLCRVRRKKAATIERGTVVALDGFWQAKSVITSVVYVATPGEHSAGYWAVCMLPLGKFFADGRVQLTPQRGRREREIHVRTYGNAVDVCHGGLNSWFPVEPIDGPLLLPLKLRYAKKAAELAAAAPPPPPPAPEAILDQFIIK